jgi:hypothetical protein
MEEMIRVLVFLCACGAMSAAEVETVHSVYLLPMSRGLDQYLANRLTAEHVFQVVTDPKLADAVFTDRIGEAFQTQLNALVPPPAPPAPAAPPPDAAKKQARKDDPQTPAPLADTVNKLTDPSLNSSFGRGRGTIFLVDMKRRMVVWSVYEPPKTTRGNDLDRMAADIVTKLKRDLNPPKK